MPTRTFAGVYKCYLNSIILFLSLNAFCQSHTFKEINKWGIKENDKVIISPVYDTIFDFDVTNKVCLACTKSKVTSATRFIKSTGTIYNCAYLNRKGERLVIKADDKDTLSVFSLNKQCVKQYQEDPKYIIASVKNRKFLIDKDFNQITTKEYTNIVLTGDPNFLIVEIKDEGNTLLRGLINIKEEEVVPFLYSNIKLNPRDSLIVACSAGIGLNREDDVYDYKGKKRDGYKRHVDMATKNFIIHKIFEPKEYYIIYNITTKEEKIAYSEEVQLHQGEELLMRNENHWFVYDMNTGKKKAYDIKNNKK